MNAPPSPPPPPLAPLGICSKTGGAGGGRTNDDVVIIHIGTRAHDRMNRHLDDVSSPTQTVSQARNGTAGRNAGGA